MPVRFQCPSCTQPIEVDDPWAGKLVGCPYCRSTVTAPQQSTLSEPDIVPTAAPLRPPMPAAADPHGAVLAYAPEGNRFAFIAALLCGLVLLLILLSLAIQSAHYMELEELQKELSKAGSDFAAQFEAAQRFMRQQQRDGVGWLITLGIVEMMTLAGVLTALIFGLLGLTRPARRGLTVFAITVSSAILLLSCVSIF